MEIEILAVIGVVLVVGVAILSGRVGIAAPLLLVVTGIGIGFLPFVPLIEIDPEIILIGVLPPLLYAAAVNVPLIDFRRNFRPVIGLSVLLVLITALAVGAAMHLVFPFIPFPVAVALGAVIAPTDAVAATSIGKRLGMPPRLVSILEGESLVNDATSLVLLKTAIAAVAGSFSFWGSVGSFAYATAIAAAIGFGIGAFTVWVRSKLENPIYDTIISFVVPFVAFIPAEVLGASGVIAVVVTGLYTGHHAARRFSATARIAERVNWRTVLFALENGVFLVMGLQLHALIEDAGGHPFRIEHLAFIALALVAALILCRTVFLVPLLFSMRRAARRLAARSQGLTHLADRWDGIEADESTHRGRRITRFRLLQRRTEADLAHERQQALGWRDGTVLAWSGMRGVVTLAAAQSIAVDVPFRTEIVLIAFLVATLTLLLHGLTLPTLIARLWPDGNRADAIAIRETIALSEDLIAQGVAALDDALAEHRSDGTAPSDDIIARVRGSAKTAFAPLALGSTGFVSTVENTESPARAYLRLSRVVLEAQRAALVEERAIGRYGSDVIRAAEEALDAHELRLNPPS
ncbi:cation:proton antiporter [Leucobacter sp. GX24907]